MRAVHACTHILFKTRTGTHAAVSLRPSVRANLVILGPFVSDGFKNGLPAPTQISLVQLSGYKLTSSSFDITVLEIIQLQCELLPAVCTMLGIS